MNTAASHLECERLIREELLDARGYRELQFACPRCATQLIVPVEVEPGMKYLCACPACKTRVIVEADTA
jgi:transcription elongation factor Elf1